MLRFVTLYKPTEIDIAKHNRLIVEIRELFRNNKIKFSVHYFDLPTNLKGEINYKAIFEKDISLNPFPSAE